MCLICINNYRIIILITGVLSLSAWVKYCYRILQTHRAHTCTHVHTRTHTCTHVNTRAHTCTHVHTRAHTYTHVHTRAHTCIHVNTRAHTCAHTGVAANRDGPLRLRECRSLAIQINTRTGDPISPRFLKFFAYKKIAMPN